MLSLILFIACFIKQMQLTQSQVSTTYVISEILKSVEKINHYNDLIKNNLLNYSFVHSIKFSQSVLAENQKKFQQNEACRQQNQPNPLVQDNFFPAAAAIDDPRSSVLKQSKKKSDGNEKRAYRNTTQQSISQISLSKKVSKNQMSQFERLQLAQIQIEQGIQKQLRKQIEQERSKKKSLKDSSPQQKKKKKDGRDDKLGFDYNGEAIQLRQQNRNSLISGGLNGQTLKAIQKLKEANKKVNPTEIQYDRKDKKGVKLIKSNQVEFTDIKTLLSEARATKGIKLIQQGRIMQEKKKITPVKQLLNTLLGRKLTKQEYRRIKQTTGNVSPFDDYNSSSRTLNSMISEPKNQQEKQTIYQFRSASESKISQVLTRRKSTITVADNKLLDNLISGPQNQAILQRSRFTRNQDPTKEEQKAEKFDSNDYYNLEYIKKGGSMGGVKKSNSTVDLASTRFPKIESNRLQMPKVRQKIKDKEEVVRAIRKKFEDKLRL